MKEENLTLYDIERASSNYLRSVIKNGFADVEVEDMIEKELYIREHRRPICSCLLYTSDAADDLTAKNIQLGIMLPMEHLERIAEKHAKKRFEDMCQ